MAEKKVSRKELLKEPDEFLSFSSRAIAYYEENPTVIHIGLLIFVLTIVAGIGVYTYLERQRLASHKEFNAVYRDYKKAVESNEPVSEEKWNEILIGFDTVYESYGSRPAGEKALLYSGHVLYKLGKYREALERYDRMRFTGLVEKGLGELAMYHKAMTLIAMKKYSPAVLILDEFSKNNDSPYRREAFASIAQIYESMGKNKEAVQSYRQYLKMFPKAPDAPLVKARIARLSSES